MKHRLAFEADRETDIGDAIVQRKLQSYFDTLGTFPPLGAEGEYSAYFEATYHSPKDRRAYLDQLIALGKPSFEIVVCQSDGQIGGAPGDVRTEFTQRFGEFGGTVHVD